VAERRRSGIRDLATRERSGQRVELRQFARADGEMRQRSRPVPVDERPPARSVRPAPR
jgi:hypothetical protein